MKWTQNFKSFFFLPLGTKYAGCYDELTHFNFKGIRNFTDCKQHCQKSYRYFGMSSEIQCYCVQYLPHINVKNIKTSKLLYSPGNKTFYLRILCNTSETGFIAVWEYTKETLNGNHICISCNLYWRTCSKLLILFVSITFLSFWGPSKLQRNLHIDITIKQFSL